MTFARRHAEYLERKREESERARQVLATPSRSLHRATYEGTSSGESVDKETPLRSEAYRRLVAALPCWACRAAPPSQAAHANYGKGMGLKTDDRSCWPACPTCHQEHDQGGHSRFARRVLEEIAGRDTRSEILASGKWPKNLPLWNEKETQE